ncbi:HAD-IC family P-type ATPase [Streptomyces racemochromogenes]|uniref:HAD-IC family P-type ATPase n=1 Tax=Streptomyces racemochromogenes TaxID=67353 RepID=UPI0031EB684C
MSPVPAWRVEVGAFLARNPDVCKGARDVILIRSAEALETAHKLDTIVLDKTGTVTEGGPALADAEPVGGFSEDELLALAAGAEADSEHPLARPLASTLSLGIADTVKDDSARAVAALQRLGTDIVMLTGDNAGTAAAIAGHGDIPRVLAEVLPEHKADEIRRLQGEGRTVGMVGDGISDAPALAQADVGLAIGTGTDVAIEAADIILVSGSLAGVVTAIRLSRATMRNIKQTLFFALVYNAGGIPIAAGALCRLWGIRLSPIIAAAAMAVSSPSVVTNA